MPLVYMGDNQENRVDSPKWPKPPLYIPSPKDKGWEFDWGG